MHVKSGNILHSSEEIRLKSGSMLQEVVCSNVKDDDDWFVVIPADRESRSHFYEIKLSDDVFIYHLKSGKNLSCN